MRKTALVLAVLGVIFLVFAILTKVSPVSLLGFGPNFYFTLIGSVLLVVALVVEAS